MAGTGGGKGGGKGGSSGHGNAALQDAEDNMTQRKKFFHDWAASRKTKNSMFPKSNMPAPAKY